MSPKVQYTLAAFRKASPLDLGPVAFAQWARGLANKSDLHTKCLAIAIKAASSEDLEVKAIGKRMQELWVNEQAALKDYWKEQEPLRKLRIRNIMSAAKDSPKLQKAVDRHQLHRALVELKQVQSYCQQQQGQQQQQKENEVFYAVGILSPSDPSDDDYSHKSSTRTSFGSIILQEGKSNIHGPGEPSSRLIGDFWFSKGVNVSDRLMSARRANMSQQNIRHETDDLLLVQIYVPEAPRQEVNLFVKFALAAASKEYLDFKATLGRTSLELSDLVGDILAAYTATNAPWQDRTGLARIEDTYIKQQRGQLPVPNGYEKVLQSDFFAKAGQLCFAIMEVKKPKTTKEDAEDDTRKLPCMMIALNMLIHANVQDVTVVGFLVNNNVCEVFIMNLEHEAIYVPKSLGRFKLPHDRLDVTVLLPALGPLTVAKPRV
ncbi:hypothetical protein BGZ54_004790 [Gamsiella multidivaricata]|nr:hypothetical protein BGZ54_004790 [Gamsiella multidivaricata]